MVWGEERGLTKRLEIEPRLRQVCGLKFVPYWNHSYEKQEYFSASQSAKLSKHKQVPFCKSSQIYRYMYIIQKLGKLRIEIDKFVYNVACTVAKGAEAFELATAY